MIYIEHNEKTILPKKFHKINNYCSIFYDQITEIFIKKNYNELKENRFSFDKLKHKSFEKYINNEITIYEMMKENEFDEGLNSFLAKQIILNVVQDFANNIYESLICAKKGKISIAYSLLRKPLLDELLILEQLAIDEKNFIKRLYFEGNPTDYDPSVKNLEKKTIIKNALKTVKTNIIFTEEIIYKLRYDKSSVNGINGYTNKALHIVTKDQNYKTTDRDLNYIFMVKEDIEEYWENYYYYVPYLLAYSSIIIDFLTFRYITTKSKDAIKTIKSF